MSKELPTDPRTPCCYELSDEGKCGKPSAFVTTQGSGFCEEHALVTFGDNLHLHCGRVIALPESDGLAAERAAVKRFVDSGTQLKRQLALVIDRACKEGDLTTYQIIGTLEMLKLDIIETSEQCKRNRETEG